jgi:Cap4 SAVED domain
MNYNPTQHPDPFWEIRVHDLQITPSLTGLCVGYELKQWRAKQFAAHMMEWLPEFALTTSELASVSPGNMVRLMREGARKIYDSEKFKNRGEFGELFLHAAVRTVFKSEPAISKIYYKTSANDTVKGFDAVHVVGPPDDMELWIGEVKFYKNIDSAIRDVVAEIEDHTQRDYLKDEFLWIKGKIDDASEHAAQLRKLLSPNTSLDVVFKRACIPVLLTYESDCLAGHDECSVEYCDAFESELRRHHANFLRKLGEIALPEGLVVRLFLLPLHVKETLIEALDENLRTWQDR